VASSGFGGPEEQRVAVYYIQSIDKIIYIIENKGIMEDFETVKVEQLEKVVWDCQKRKIRKRG